MDLDIFSQRLVLVGRNLKGKRKEHRVKQTPFFSSFCVLDALVFA